MRLEFPLEGVFEGKNPSRELRLLCAWELRLLAAEKGRGKSVPRSVLRLLPGVVVLPVPTPSRYGLPGAPVREILGGGTIT